MEKVILTTGGTGGHIFPALAVAEELRRRNPRVEILFMGSFYGPESGLVTRAGLSFKGLHVRGFLGRGLRAVPAFFEMCAAMVNAFATVASFKPDVVAGFGGYASFAPVMAAFACRRPVLIHEQNAVAGSGNRFLGRLADRICVSLPATWGFDKNTVLTGNPVRAAIRNSGCQQRDWTGKRLLVLGGSQGSHAINMYICQILKKLKDHGVKVRHQCGEKDLGVVRETYARAGMDPGMVAAFVDNMAEAYAWADLAICRSGASTVAELCATGLPAVLVPFPAAIHDHQTLNAAALVDAGAACLVPEPRLEDENTVELLLDLLSNPDTLAAMSLKARELAKMNAAEEIVNQMESIQKTGMATGHE